MASGSQCPSFEVTPRGSATLAAFALAALLLSWSHAALCDQRLVDTGIFSVTTPGDFDWNVTADRDRVLMRLDRQEAGQTVGTTAILVLRTRPSDDKCGLPAQETADNYCDSEEFQLWLSGQVSGLFGVSDLTRESVNLGGKELYSMRYHLEFAEEYGGAVTDNRMYLFFPPTFAADNYFFVFMQTEACKPEHCADAGSPVDESLLISVIASLQTPSPASR